MSTSCIQDNLQAYPFHGPAYPVILSDHIINIYPWLSPHIVSNTADAGKTNCDTMPKNSLITHRVTKYSVFILCINSDLQIFDKLIYGPVTLKVVQQ